MADKTTSIANDAILKLKYAREKYGKSKDYEIYTKARNIFDQEKEQFHALQPPEGLEDFHRSYLKSLDYVLVDYEKLGIADDVNAALLHQKEGLKATVAYLTQLKIACQNHQAPLGSGISH